MQKIKIYLIGGMTKFSKENFDSSNEWRLDIKKQLETICEKYNVKVMNPNDYYNFLDSDKYDSEREIMEFDLHHVKTSDLCICNFNDPKSLGSMAELAIAYEHRIPVIGLAEYGEELHPWQKEMVLKLFYDREDLIHYVLNYFLD